LLQAVRLAEAETRPGLASADYAAVLRRLSTLREPIDAFFDQVMVLCEDERVRQNRLALLSSIERLFLDIADIARLQG
jgi:glycyl-tRNA synthetase beta chain